MKILVIDDDDLVLFTLSKILRGNGDTVITAKDGARGMRAFLIEKPDLVITDIIMPEQEGLGTIMMMRRERPKAKIIAISGGGRVGNLDVLEAARALGADDVIKKPFEPDEVLRRVSGVTAPADDPGAAAPAKGREDVGATMRRLANMARDRRPGSPRR